MILPLYSALMTPYLGTCIQWWSSKGSAWIRWTVSRGETEDDQRARAPLLWREPEGVWVVKYGEQKALRTPYSNLPTPKGDKKKKKLEKDSWQECVVVVWGRMTLNWKIGDLDYIYINEIFYHEGSETLAQIAQGSCTCTIPRSVQLQAGWDSRKPGLVKGIPIHGRGGWN